MFTNQTQNLGLPQWEENDTPAWADDVNNAFEKIDESYGALKTADETSQTQIEALTQAQTTQANQITDLQESSGNNTAQLAQIQAQVNVNTAHLADVDANIKATDKTVADNKAAIDQEIETINNTVDDLSATVATLENEHNTQQTDINNLKTDTENNAQNIQTLQTSNVQRDADINKNKADIAELQTEQQELSGEVAGFSADITQNTSDITAIKSKNTQQDNKIGDLETKTTALENLINVVGGNASDALQTANRVMAFFPLHFTTASITPSNVVLRLSAGTRIDVTVHNSIRKLLVIGFFGTLTTSEPMSETYYHTKIYSSNSGFAVAENNELTLSANSTAITVNHLKVLVFPNSNSFTFYIRILSNTNNATINLSNLIGFNVSSEGSFEILTEKATEIRSQDV